jgi:formate hydrogenlyase subunit 3/multisubunit Na+/H+ antiporter MnhD subunit
MRIIGFSLLSWTLTILKIKTDSTDIEALAGLFNHELILAISIFASLFTIVGMPLLGGFPVLQALYSDLYSFEPRFSSLVIICITILSITILNWILTSLKSEYNAELLPTNISSNVFLLTCVILLFILGVFPNQIYPRISGIIDGFQFLIK